MNKGVIMKLIITIEASDDFCTNCSWLDQAGDMCDLFGDTLELIDDDEYYIRCEDCFNAEDKN